MRRCFRRPKQRAQNHESVVADRDAHILKLSKKSDKAAATIAKLHGDCSMLRAEIAAQEDRQKAAGKERRAIEGKLAESREEIQTLESYVDRRKGEWDRLNDELSEYRDALIGMQAELDSHNKIVAAHDKEKSTLNRQLEELRQKCSELDGRRAERELANKELNQFALARKRANWRCCARNAMTLRLAVRP